MGRRRLLAAKFAEWVCLGALPILSAAKATYPTGAAAPKTLLQFLHVAFLDWFVAIVFALGLAGLLAKLVQEYLNPESKIRLKAVLDTLLEAYFDVPPAERYKCRVTLFKADAAKKLLEPQCRSGIQYQRGIQSLVIDADNEAGNEGISGQAWFRNTTVSVDDLPECPNPWSDSDPVCIEWAGRGFIPVAKASKMKVKSCSILATPVRDMKGNPWGVLTLDSRMPQILRREREELVTSLAAAIGKML